MTKSRDPAISPESGTTQRKREVMANASPQTMAMESSTMSWSVLPAGRSVVLAMNAILLVSNDRVAASKLHTVATTEFRWQLLPCHSSDFSNAPFRSCIPRLPFQTTLYTGVYTALRSALQGPSSKLLIYIQNSPKP